MMDNTQTISRWQEITLLWNDNRWLYVLAGVLLGILITPAAEQVFGHLNDLIGNLVPEAISVLFTILILDRLAENRATEQLKTRLIREAASQSNETAKAAVDWMRAEGWLTVDDDVQLLNGAYLRRANLQRAYLNHANLQGANLTRANLTKARLREANLRAADLTNASLEGASIRYADLTSANLENSNLRVNSLRKSNLQDANLSNADLSKANLINVNLKGANLQNAQFDENTLLPDGQVLKDNKGNTSKNEQGKSLYTPKSYWTPDTAMSRYTDPNHPDFWQPDWVKEQDH